MKASEKGPIRVAFRADSSTQMGTGHLRRCLALADAIVQHGGTVAFVCRPRPGNVSAEVAERGYTLLELPALAHDQDVSEPSASEGLGWLGADPETDAAQTKMLVDEWGGASALVVDHYGIDWRWERALRSSVGKVLVIDDLADRRHECDILTDSLAVDNASDRYAHLVDSGTRLLLGPRFAVLRKEFLRQRASVPARDGHIKKILVTFGGVDEQGYAARAVRALRPILDDDVVIDVVVGAGGRHVVDVQKICAADPNVRVHIDCVNIAELMRSADLGIGGGGGTAWERACMGLPSIVAAIAPNQNGVARALSDALCGLLVSAGDDFDATLVSVVGVLLNQPALVKALGANGAQLVDGRGTERLVRELLMAAIRFRAASMQDMQAVWEWRNHLSVRKASMNTEKIPWSAHQTWYRTAIESPSVRLLIAENDAGPIGVVRFDLRAEVAEISIYLEPGSQGNGWGPRILSQAQAWLAQNEPKVERINATVRAHNPASSRAFESAGYRIRAHLYERELRDAAS